MKKIILTLALLATGQSAFALTFSQVSVGQRIQFTNDSDDINFYCKGHRSAKGIVTRGTQGTVVFHNQVRPDVPFARLVGVDQYLWIKLDGDNSGCEAVLYSWRMSLANEKDFENIELATRKTRIY